ncbi:MAG: protein-glutamate O-methyltransferase CheR [Gemmatimonadetes bacterium]|nr:protein-glutamate O-methyltransferase CheR [Gemmatimonadota bacterium]
MTISPEDYRFLSDFLKKHSGLQLGDGKEYLIIGRLPPVAASSGFASLEAMVQALRNNPPQALLKSVCDAMTTGETLFFRDGAPFDAFRDRLLPEAAARARAAGRALRIWCAASSTGQEVYSVMILLKEAEAKLQGLRVEVVATDYSTPTLARAKEAIYNQFEVQRGLPAMMLVKYFQPVPQGFQVKPELRQGIAFSEQNLLRPFTSHGLFDIVFLRNVLIYFDVADKADVLNRMARQLHPGGVILLGGTENTIGITDQLGRVEGFTAPVFGRTSDPMVTIRGRKSPPLAAAPAR